MENLRRTYKRHLKIRQRKALLRNKIESYKRELERLDKQEQKIREKYSQQGGEYNGK